MVDLISLLGIPLLGVAYRIRGGAINGWNTTLINLLWAATLAGWATLLMSGALSLPAVALLILAARVAQMIPVSSFYSVGHVYEGPYQWPGFFLPKLTGAQWGALSGARKVDYAMLGLGAVAVLRAALVFGLLGVLGAPHAITGGLVFAGLYPLAYALGWLLPGGKGALLNHPEGQQQINNAELLAGAAWGVALGLAL